MKMKKFIFFFITSFFAIAEKYESVILPIQELKILSRKTEFISKILVKENQEVKKGDFLIYLNKEKLIIQRDFLENQLKNYEKQVSYYQKLFLLSKQKKKSGHIEEEELINVAINYYKIVGEKERIKKELALVEYELSNIYSISAPFSGIITKIFIRKEELVQPNQPLLEIKSNKKFRSFFLVNFSFFKKRIKGKRKLEAYLKRDKSKQLILNIVGISREILSGEKIKINVEFTSKDAFIGEFIVLSL